MPYSSDDETIDFIFGVINWKELVDAKAQAALNAEVAESIRAARAPVTVPAWATGPSSDRSADLPSEVRDSPVPRHVGEGDDFAVDEDRGCLAPLADQLMLAQQTAAAARASDTRSRAALYRALGRAFDFAAAANGDPAGYAALLARAGISQQLRAPMTPIVKLVFGAEYDKTRVTEFATVLAHAARCNVPVGALADFLDMAEGGIKGIVAAERALRRPACRPDPLGAAQAAFADRPPLATVNLATGLASGMLVLLVARVGDEGAVDIMRTVAASDPRAATLISKAARGA